MRKILEIHPTQVYYGTVAIQVKFMKNKTNLFIPPKEFQALIILEEFRNALSS